MAGGAYLTALLAQQGGAAAQQVNNYQDAVAEAGNLTALNAQQKQWDAQNAASQREFERMTKNDARGQANLDRDFAAGQSKTAADKAAQDQWDGVGIHPPPGFLKPNKGVDPTPEQKANNALQIGAWYASQGAGGKAEQYERQARDYAGMSNSDTRNSLAAQREAGLEAYRQQNLAGITSRFNSRQQQQAQEFSQTLGTKVQQFAASYSQRGQIANLNSQDREYIAQLAGAIRVNVNSDDEAVKEAIAQYETQGRAYDAATRSLDPAVSGAAVPPGPFQPPASGGPVFNIYGAGAPTPPAGTVPTIVPNANGTPAIPPNPNATPTTQSGGPHSIYGSRNAIAPNPNGGNRGAGGTNAQGRSRFGGLYGTKGNGVTSTVSQPVPQNDPAVLEATTQVISGWSASGATPQTLPDILKRAYPGLSDQQRQAVADRVLMQFGYPLQLPAGGMRAVGPNPGTVPSSPGGAAPANPFRLLTQ